MGRNQYRNDSVKSLLFSDYSLLEAGLIEACTSYFILIAQNILAIVRSSNY
jgi:hypothetical protein